ncbi:MAG: hypothetical protein HOP15_05580 [Planctomycetes bacterium]|nr:hypothetical protein [Planctomycetota bacterium]
MSFWARTTATFAALVLAGACLTQNPASIKQHLWWAGLGPVLPHETFPADCALCHEGTDWQGVRADFTFDHAAETGYTLAGAHARATCLLCHNDRGPVAMFQTQGCAGCHEDIHRAQLGPDCARCHQENTWQPFGQIELHARTRFPLIGVHAATACHRCHQGAELGSFVPTDTECLTCHRSDLARAVNPNHAGLGWVDRCNRCHLPRTWNHAEINN